MKSQLTWKCSFLGNTTNIYSHGIPAGRLTENCFKQTATGELNGKRYTFRTNGFLQQQTNIIDDETNSLIGSISYNSWRTRAEIRLANKIVHFRYDNAWNTRWSLFDATGVHYYRFKGSNSKGNVEFDEQDELLVLSGLYVTNYYWQMSVAVAIAIFVPLIVVHF